MVTRPPFSSPEPDAPAAAAKVAPKATARKTSARPAAAKRAKPAKRSVGAPPKKTAATKSTPKKPPAKAKAPRKTAAKASATDDAIDPPPSNGWPARKPGPVEVAVRAELEQLGVHRSALAASAVAMARNVDEAESPAGAASAARELRMVLPLAKTTVNPLSPSAAEKSDSEDKGGTVVGPNRLKALREKSAKRTPA